MKAKIKSITGTSKGELNLPMQFDEPVRPDLIKRAVLAIQSHKRQPYGTDPEAGKKYSSKISRRRRDYKTAYGYGISRVPRKILSYRGTRFNWEGATAPNTKGGRQAHPPKAEKKWGQKINNKERRKAIRSAMAASIDKELVSKRGHLVSDYPLVLETKIESLKKAKEVVDLLNKLGLDKELERSSKRREKTGKPRRRGRPYKTRKGPLFVVSGKCELQKSALNIPGVDVVEVRKLNAELLAPGTDYGRLTIYTEGAIEQLDKLKLFTESRKTQEKPVKKEEKKEKKEKKTKKSSKKKTQKKPSKKKTAKKSSKKKSKKTTKKGAKK